MFASPDSAGALHTIALAESVTLALIEQARAYLRVEQGFIWNATNISRQLRSRVVELCVAYGARVRIVYLEAPYAIVRERNRVRSTPLPEAALLKLARSLEVPDPFEAPEVEYVLT